ncbi:MAG: response regulator, partial [Proteobacteria bacterium]
LMAEKWLVIDDSATIQRVIKLAFQDYDVQITEADSTQDALRELSRTPPSLVIVDAALAGVQSVQDFSRLQQSSPQSAFVVLEGSYDHIDENQFRGAGFRYFLKKPFDAAQLIAITREALGRSIPHRFQDRKDEAPRPKTVPLPAPFSLPEELRDAPPPPPPMARPYREDPAPAPVKNDSFDLGLDHDEPADAPPPPFAFDPFGGDESASHIGAHIDDPVAEDDDHHYEAKPYNPDAVDEETYIASKNPASNFNMEEEYPAQIQDTSYLASPLSGMLEPMLQEEMAKLVRQSVEEYCRKHFAELAREYLGREIEKLTQERSRLLVDK